MELETFKSTVLPLRDKLLKYSVKLTDDGADAEDIVQEAFLKLWYIRDRWMDTRVWKHYRFRW